MKSDIARPDPITLLIFLNSSCYRAIMSPLVSQTIQKVRTCMVQIQAYAESSNTSPREERIIAGTGFVINPEGYIITNAHVADGVQNYVANVNATDKKALAAFAGEDYYDEKDNTLHRRRFSSTEYRIVDIDRLHDLALLKLAIPLKDLPYPGKLPIKVSSCALSLTTPDEGTPIAISGYPLDIPSLVTQTGIVASNTFFDFKRADAENKSVDYLLIDATINPGNSGGPVYLPTTGEIVGVIAAYRTAPVMENGAPNVDLSQNSGLAVVIPIKYVIQLLKKNDVAWQKN